MGTTEPRTRWSLVIGGARGLGAACALELAKRGHSMILTYRASQDAANVVCGAALGAGAPSATPVHLDLVDPAACERQVLELLATHGPPSCLVHSAAELLRAPLTRTDVESFARTLTVNCTSAYAVARSVGLSMYEAGEGSMVLLSSVIGPLGARDRVAYATSKAGLIGMTKALAVELAPAVRVNAIVLGTFATEMNRSLIDDQVALAGVTSRIPLCRLGEPLEVGKLATFLLCDSSFVTGAAWELDGGLSARLSTPAGDPGHLTA
jgi:acetoacetyl-CoA reductase